MTFEAFINPFSKEGHSVACQIAKIVTLKSSYPYVRHKASQLPRWSSSGKFFLRLLILIWLIFFLFWKCNFVGLSQDHGSVLHINDYIPNISKLGVQNHKASMSKLGYLLLCNMPDTARATVETIQYLSLSVYRTPLIPLTCPKRLSCLIAKQKRP